MKRWFYIGAGPRDTYLALLAIVAVASLPELLPGWFIFEAGRQPRTLLVILAAAVYGVVRVLGNHPAAKPTYLQWLLSTPWTAARPLPLGPLRVVPGDALAVGLLAVASLGTAPWAPVAVVAVATAAYYLSLAFWLSMTGGTLHALALIAGMALAARAGGEWLVAPLIVLALLYPVAWHGVGVTLRRFPWTDVGPFGRHLSSSPTGVPSPFLPGSKQRQQTTHRDAAGWPHGILAPMAEPAVTPRLHRLAFSVTMGWIFFCIVGLIDTSEDRLPVYAFAWIVVALALVHRLILYFGPCGSPITIAGRVSLGRLIIPRYDVAWLAPVTAVVVRAAVPRLGGPVGVPSEVSVGAALAASLAILLLAGPDVRSWRLTGHHRFRGPVSSRETVATG